MRDAAAIARRDEADPDRVRATLIRSRQVAGSPVPDEDLTWLDRWVAERHAAKLVRLPAVALAPADASHLEPADPSAPADTDTDTHQEHP